MEFTLQVDGGDLAATLTLPEHPRAGVVVLHGAEAGERSFFLYEHLATVLASQDVAVLRFDRRPYADGHDVPLALQASDARAAIGRLRDFVGAAPVGVWGYSQGGWVAPLVAATAPDEVQFVICVSASGVSPADQMRHGCATQLRAHGYSDDDVASMTATREAVEHYLRTGQQGAAAQAALDRAAARSWFPLAWLPSTLAEPGSWRDMDVDPQPVFARVSCPVLAFYGESDEWIPVDASVAAWRAARAGALTGLTVVRLPGTDHLPTIGGVEDPAMISELYRSTLTGWIRTTVTGR